jgi:hypothetical protein
LRLNERGISTDVRRDEIVKLLLKWGAKWDEELKGAGSA